ncbi:MAG TPA: cupin domain-containing protein [Phycisphaerales bacterium]|nr:cupin domain-containing protein [Phycisphaerales bacterium]
MAEQRLRTPPAERFARPAHLFDLRRVAEELRREPTAVRDGHRQKTLYKNGESTTALFDFEPGGTIPPHAAAGTVTILAVEGEFDVVHGGRAYRLSPGQLLVFAPDVPHDVRSPTGGVMLLTVSLANGEGPV